MSATLDVACGARTELADGPHDAAASLDATTHDATADALADANGDASFGADATIDAADATADGAVLVSDAAIVAVAAGGAASCVLLSDESVRCWGDNTYGELGDGTTTSSSIPITPFVSATALVAPSGLVTCALLESSALWCWGFGGRVGDGTTTQRDAPVEVIDAGVAYVSGGGNATCAVLQSGGARCWGYNNEGTLGDGTKTDRTAPVNVLSLGGAVTKIATGGFQTCAILSTGAMQCWGENFDGQLGDGTTTDHLTPVDVVSLGGTATSVTTGEAQVCALLADGSVRCWGDGASGQLGNGKLTIVNETPTQVSLGESATSLACGEQFCCATLASGTIRCWGDNTYGQLGDGTTIQRSSPVAVMSLTNAVSVSAQGVATCALLASSSVECWGNLQTGTFSTTPVAISL